MEEHFERKGNYKRNRCPCCRPTGQGGKRKIPKYILRAAVFHKTISYIPLHVPTTLKCGEECDCVAVNMSMIIVGSPLRGLNRFNKSRIRKEAVNKHFDYVKL